MASDPTDSVTIIGPVTPGNLPEFNSTTVLKDSGISSVNVGPGGTSGEVQTNNGSSGFAGITNVQLTALVNEATSSLSGTVPAWPNNTTTFFRGDGTYATPPNVSASAPGYILAWPNNTTTFYRGDGTYATLNFPAISGVVSLTQGGLGGSQNAATANQIPVFPGSSGAAAPTTIGGIGGLFDTIFSSTVGQILVRLTGGWGAASLGYANPVWWGADPTGASDSTSAFNSAKAASTFIVFPPGKFKFLSAISFALTTQPASVTIEGAGADNTILYFPTGNGLSITENSLQQSFHLRNLTISTGAAASGTGFSATSTDSTAVVQSDITGVTFRGDDFGGNAGAGSYYWTTGASLVSLVNVSLTNTFFLGSNASGGLGIGLSISGTASFYAFNTYLNSTQFQSLATGLVAGSYVQNVSMVNVSFGTITGINFNGTSGVNGALSVTNSYFATTTAAVTNPGSTTALWYLNFTNNNVTVTGSGGNTTIGITLNEIYSGTISGNAFQGNATGTNIAILIAAIESSNGVSITGNTFTDFVYGFDFAGATGINAQANVFAGVATPVLAAGTNNVIANNYGYNPVGTSAAATMGTSPYTVTAGASPETHYINQSATSTATITKGGHQIGALAATTTDYVVQLGPGESYITTWLTTAPTFVRDIH